MARPKSEMPAHGATDSNTETRRPEIFLVVLAILWLALIVGCFFSVELAKNNDARLTRWDFWVYADLLDPPQPAANAGRSGWQYFPQRLDLLALAALILGGAWCAGHLVLRIVGPRLAAPSLERTVFACGLGLSTLSLSTLGAGLLGWLSRPFLAGIIALFVAVELLLRAARYFSAPGPMNLTNVATAGLTSAARPVQNPKSPRPERPGRKPKLSSALLVAVAAPFLLAMLLGSLLPSTDFDVNEYHFEGPKEFFQAGRISFLEHNVYTSFPFGTEMLTLLAMVLAGDWYRGALAGKCVQMCFGPLTALALLAAGRRCFGRTASGTAAGVSAALIYLATPWVYRISTIAYAEGGVCFYLFAALLAVILAIDLGNAAADNQSDSGMGQARPDAGDSRRDECRQFLLAGLLAGSAMACKYPALLSVVIPLGGAVLVSNLKKIDQQPEPARDNAVARWRFASVSPWLPPGTRRWSSVAGFGLGVMIAVGPWLAKNLFETGNPVYPLAYSLFDGRDWDAALNARWRKAHSPSTFALDSLADLALDVAFRNTWVSPLLVGLAPWALFESRWRRRVLWLWCYIGWLFLSCWLFTHRIDRFWVPLLPVMALLAGAGAAWCWSAFRHRWARATLIAPLAVVGLYQLAFITDRHGLCGYNDFLRDLDEAAVVAANISAPEIVYLNDHLPAGAKVLSVGDAEMFEARFDVVYNTVFDRSIFEDWLATSPDEPGGRGALRESAAIRQKLADEGISHVYVNWLEILRYRAPGSYGYTDFVSPERFGELKKLGILGTEWSIPEATLDVDRLDPTWREELEFWGARLKTRRGDKETFITFQVFPVTR
jgi:hypothetical protein